MNSTERNRQVVERLYSAADEGNLEEIAGCFAKDLVDHDANRARRGGGTDYESMMMAFEQFLQGFPDTRHTLQDVIAEGDRVVVRVSAEGTHTGRAFGFAPSGRRFLNDSIVVYRLSEGVIVEKWSRERRGVFEGLEDASGSVVEESQPPTSSPFEFFSTEQLPLRADVPGARFFEVSLEQSMLTYFELEPEAFFPEHSHVAEQITLVLRGHLLFILEGQEVVVGPMEGIAIASGISHSVRSLDAVVAVDSWAPPPERYRQPR